MQIPNGVLMTSNNYQREVPNEKVLLQGSVVGRRDKETTGRRRYALFQ
jgi:hypothetical protein